MLPCVQRCAGTPATASSSCSVGQQHVAPHLRVAGGDAGEVAEARAGQLQEILAHRLRRDAVDQREGDEVGQVADGGEGGVVRLRRHLRDVRCRGLPRPRRRAALCGLGALDRRQDHLLAVVQVGVGVLHARDFLAGDRVAGTKDADVRAARGARRR
jgi:hypothetical protein